MLLLFCKSIYLYLHYNKHAMSKITLELQDDEKNQLLEFYLNKQKDIQNKISGLSNLFKRNEEKIMLLRNGKEPSHTPASKPLFDKEGSALGDYNPKWTWLQKGIYAIKYKGKGIPFRDIVNTILFFEPSLKENKHKVVSGVSVLGVKAQKNEIVSRCKEGSDYIYGLPEWFENGELKDEYT